MFVWNVNPESAIKNNIICNETMLVLWVFCVTCAVWVKGTELNCVARDTEATGRPSVCVCDTLISRLLECPCAGELGMEDVNYNLPFSKSQIWGSVRCFLDGIMQFCGSQKLNMWFEVFLSNVDPESAVKKSLLSWMRRCWFCGFSVWPVQFE